MAEPLSNGQKMFNQRLLAAHCVSESRAREIWQDISQQTDHDMGGSTYEESVAASNEQLKHCGLEIVAVSIKSQDGGKPESHYSMINIYPDAVAKKSFHTAFTVNQYAFVRLVLEKLVEGPAARSTLINLRTELEEAHKLALDPTEQALEKMVQDKWLQATDPNRRGSMSSKIQLAPRAYMELSFLLVGEFGMEKDDLPQQIYHRV